MVKTWVISLNMERNIYLEHDDDAIVYKKRALVYHIVHLPNTNSSLYYGELYLSDGEVCIAILE